VILTLVLCAFVAVRLMPPPPFERDCSGSPLCAALWTLLFAGAVTAVLFFAELLLNAFRDSNRSS
jgi:hypothetical protein